MVDGVLIRKHSLGHALAHNDHQLAALSVRGVEIASGNQRDAERREESRRNRSKPPARIFFARCLDMTVGGETKARAEVTGIAPRNGAAHCNSIDARQRRDTADRLLVEGRDLFGCLSVRHLRHVDREHMPHVEAGLGCLQRQAAS